MLFSVVFEGLHQRTQSCLKQAFYLKLTVKNFSMIPSFQIRRLSSSILIFQLTDIAEYIKLHALFCVMFPFYNSNYGIHFVVCVSIPSEWCLDHLHSKGLFEVMHTAPTYLFFSISHCENKQLRSSRSLKLAPFREERPGWKQMVYVFSQK